jgi:hypothetical protein
MTFLTPVLAFKRQTRFRYGCCLFLVPKISQSFLGRWINYLPLRVGSFLLGLLPTTIVALSTVYAQDASPLHLEKEIPLPGVEGRIDHFSVDVLGQRLFVAALENGTVEVVDVTGLKGVPKSNRRDVKGLYQDRALGVPVKQHFEYQTHKTGSKNNGDDVPLPSDHADKGGQTDDDRKPIDNVRRGKDDMEPEPDGQVQNYAHDGTGNRGQSGSQSFVTAQFFDVRATQEDPKETRHKRSPGRHQSAKSGR